MSRRGAVFVTLLAVAHCGGSAPLTTPDAAADASSTPLDATSTEQAIDVLTSDSTQSSLSPDGNVLPAHRAFPSACPQTHDAGSLSLSCDGGPPFPGNPCATDSDCKSGMDGVCLCSPYFSPAPGQDSGPVTLYTGTICSYDECFTDSDCGPHVPCDCRDPNIYGQPNVCLRASNCAVDSDCPAPGLCSESLVSGQSPSIGFFCHTPQDQCMDSSDCLPAGPGTAECEFDLTSKKWVCLQIPSRP